MKRTIRGMLPYKRPRGVDAMKAIKCYVGVPVSLSVKEMEVLEDAHMNRLNNPNQSRSVQSARPSEQSSKVVTMAKIINTSGKRKTAIARATLKAGKGVIRVNSVTLESYGTEVTRMKISEPLLLVPNAVSGIDVTIDVARRRCHGTGRGGPDGTRPRYPEWHNEPSIKDIYLAYDRTLLVNDSRAERTEETARPWRTQEVPKVLSLNHEDMMRGQKS